MQGVFKKQATIRISAQIAGIGVMEWHQCLKNVLNAGHALLRLLPGKLVLWSRQKIFAFIVYPG
jgi:hypothetical protein